MARSRRWRCSSRRRRSRPTCSTRRRRIAFASMAAFSVSAVADWLTYSALAGKRYQVRVNGSNVVGAAVDSVLFPLIAFGAFLPGVMLGQWVAKVAGGALWAIVLNRRPFWRRA